MLEAAFRSAGLSDRDCARVKEAHRESGEPWPVVVSRLGLLPDDRVVEALATAFSIPAACDADIPETVPASPLSPAFLRYHRALLLEVSDERVRLGLVDPTDEEAALGVAFALGRPVEVSILGFHVWRRATDRLDRSRTEAASASGHRGARWTQDAGGLRDLSLDAPAVRLVETLIADAVEARASDIHIERKPAGGQVRFRIDGRLVDRDGLSASATESLIARLKVLGDMDVADHRKAQDGRTALSARGRPIDVRLSIIPSAHGEGAVIRLLDRADVRLDFASLGFAPAEIDRIKAAVAKPQGLFLVSGPTGGGKTTTLYAAVNALRSRDRKVVTVEDPIEYYFEDVHQTQLDAAAGLSFANALRAFLRHDPDVILVGEIRDPDTAKTAIQAALTGHLVLSTLHANEASAVPARLIEMGVEPYLLAATLSAATAQRLVRRLCPACAVPVDAPSDLLDRAGLDDLRSGDFRAPSGCPACSDGYRGRMVISESLILDRTLEDKVRANAPISALREHLPTSLLADGLAKAAAGQTSVDEVLRVLEAS